MRSLRVRLLVAATLVLFALVALSAAGLERAFRNAALQSERDKLQGLVYALLGAAEFDHAGLPSMPAGRLPDPRLDQPDSGLEAAIFDARGRRIWSSPSLLRESAPPEAPGVGEWLFLETGDPPRFTMAFGVRWLDERERPTQYTFLAAEDPATYAAQMVAFRTTLGVWLAGTVLGLLLVQLLVLALLLRPLTALVGELRNVESGRSERIDGRYPSELSPLTTALNAMIQHERHQQTRYRNALGDLAHSLKTPLAALRGITGESGVGARERERLDEQLGRMQSITDHQLRKAAAAGRRRFAEPVPVRPLAERLCGALSKVYADKRPAFELAIDPALRLRVDEGDLYELLGNLLDNAAKWCAHRIAVDARTDGNRAMFVVDDDGPGFPPEPQELLQRGVRADMRVPGQGLGLAAVDGIVRAYDGEIALQRSPLGGARVEVTLVLA